MALIVQKFGGTSVAEPGARSRLADKVVAARARGDRVVLVVSAMGRKGAPYATDTLLGLLAEQDPNPDPLASDLLASCGELISACLVSALLRSRGVAALPLSAYTAGIRAEGPAGDATPKAVDAAAILASVEAGEVPVIAGFQGVGPRGQILTLGRGGSDTSAVAVGLALRADYVDIYTDVPGVAKADPRVVKEAPFMDFLDYDSMFRLATLGARVLHDRSASLAQAGRVLVRVRSTFDEGEGTLIGPEGARNAAGKLLVAPAFVGLASLDAGPGKKRISAVFSKGRGAELADRASAAAQAFGAEPFIREDPDAISFLIGSEQAKELTQSLFAALN